jgi:hypothetical protein
MELRYLFVTCRAEVERSGVSFGAESKEFVLGLPKLNRAFVVKAVLSTRRPPPNV